MLMDLVRKNRSYRGFDHSRKVTAEELKSFVEAARLCPSSVNVQPVNYSVIELPSIQNTEKLRFSLFGMDL